MLLSKLMRIYVRAIMTYCVSKQYSCTVVGQYMHVVYVRQYRHAVYQDNRDMLCFFATGDCIVLFQQVSDENLSKARQFCFSRYPSIILMNSQSLYTSRSLLLVDKFK